jgi:hypothetical protein
MNIVKRVLGYFWAGLGIPVILITFIGEEFWVEKLIVDSGFKVAAWAGGGEIVQTLQLADYQTRIHRPVFDGLFWEKRTGFVQIDWTSGETLPEQIDERIDFDRDGVEDFQITLNTQTNTAILVAFDPRVVSLSQEEVLVFEHARTVRVVLKKNS